ncbi:hypothetical protein [Fuchsiella alkaliacetigena]|uniref:hypothetical protein n=1 Tax=Fuchsiella alkaliacetigena TaxID=957042 RepID=UPI00200B4618|nr:hypothetical protein [Fuchsiella alkaliacetigena]MCK8825197.1 hypothetical protein [Fuchsiella alkaliacetigena]
MQFKRKDLRSGQTKILNGKEMKKSIIKQTRSKYDHQRPKDEYTGLRSPQLDKLLNQLDSETYAVYKEVFLVSALYKVNNNPQTRYLILIDGIQDSYTEITNLIENHIPIWALEIIDRKSRSKTECSNLSQWFRENMGRAFSFVDMDYLLHNKKEDTVLLIEEKNSSNYKVGYGQLLSYEEMAVDAIIKPTKLLFLYHNSSRINYLLTEEQDINTSSPYFNSIGNGFKINSNYLQSCNFENLINIIQAEI